MFAKALGSRALPDASQELIEAVVPEQHAGGMSNVDISHICADSAAADVAYTSLKALMENVNHWHSYVKGMTAHFTVTDASGKAIQTQPRPGDHLKINIPGPKSKLGEGYDWVTIVDKQERSHRDATIFYFTAMPFQNPRSVETGTAHFLKAGASTTFMALKQKRIVRMIIKSRNEVPNSHLPQRRDGLRNRAVGLFAAIFFSQYQWTKLAKALLRLARKSNRQHIGKKVKLDPSSRH